MVANDWVRYIIVSGQVMLPDGRVLGPSGVLFVESLMGVARKGELPVVVENTRLMRLRADDSPRCAPKRSTSRTSCTSASPATWLAFA